MAAVRHELGGPGGVQHRRSAPESARLLGTISGQSPPVHLNTRPLASFDDDEY